MYLEFNRSKRLLQYTSCPRNVVKEGLSRLLKTCRQYLIKHFLSWKRHLAYQNFYKKFKDFLAQSNAEKLTIALPLDSENNDRLDTKARQK